MRRAQLFVLLFVLKCGTALEVKPTWSNWTSCPMKTNCTVRLLQCWTADQPQNHVTCHHGNQTVEEELHNCSSCNGSWEVPEVTHPCEASCYNSSMWQEQKCSNDSSCVLRSRTPCNDLSLCQGTWIESNTNCNATCTSSGIITTTRKCMKGNMASLECSGTYGFVRETKFQKVCPKLSWSSWTSGECSVTCGGGKNIHRRTCRQNAETWNVSCNTNDCPAWSTWSEEGSCLNNVGTRTRLCTFMGTVHNNCSGSGPFQVRLQQCSASTTAETKPICPDTLNTYTIPLVVGLNFLFALVLVAMILLYKTYKVKQRSSNGKVDFIYENSPATVHSNCNDTEANDATNETETPTVKVVPYKIPLKDPDIDESDLFKPMFKKQRSKSLNNRLYSHKEVPEITVDDSDIFSSNLQVKQTDVADLVDGSSLFTKQEWHSLRPSVRRAYRQKFLPQEDASWQRTQTLKHPRNENKASNSPRHRRTHSEGAVLDEQSASSIPPSKPERKNSIRQPSLRSASVSHPPKPVKPMRTHKMRSSTFNVSTWYIDSPSSETLEIDGHLYPIGSNSLSKSAPQLDQLCDTTLEAVEEVSSENSDNQDDNVLEEDAS